MAVNCHRHPSDALEVLWIRGDNDVHVLRPSDDAPSIDGKAADQNKLHLRFRESAQELIERGFSQWRRAEPANCISL